MRSGGRAISGPSRLRDVSTWVEQYRRTWEERLDRLDEFLREIQTEEQLDDRI